MTPRPAAAGRRPLLRVNPRAGECRGGQRRGHPCCEAAVRSASLVLALSFRRRTIGRARELVIEQHDVRPGAKPSDLWRLNVHLRIDGHHLVHWGHGGGTDVDNLVSR